MREIRYERDYDRLAQSRAPYYEEREREREVDRGDLQRYTLEVK